MTTKNKASRLNDLCITRAAAATALIFCSALGAYSGEACVQDPAQVVARKPTAAITGTPLKPELAAKLDAAVKKVLPDVAAPGIIAGVRTPEGYWKAAYGFADPDKKTPMKVGMFTRIGSVTKTYTGTVLMHLVENGLLSLDDRIGQYVSGIPNGDKITLRQLANMTSGISSYTILDSFQNQLFGHPETIFTPQDLLEYAIPESPVFEPGARFDYSNTNIVLLGLVIEKVTAKPLEEAFKTMIFEPLGLEQTLSPGVSTEIPAPYPQGFTVQGLEDHPQTATNATRWNPSWSWATGDLIATLDDLLTYGRAVGTGQGLLSRSTQMQRLNAFPSPWGYGIALGCVDGWIGHSGSEPGFNTTMFYDTSSDMTIVVQANSDIMSGDCGGENVLPDNNTEASCSSPATRVFIALSAALGHEYTGHM